MLTRGQLSKYRRLKRFDFLLKRNSLSVAKAITGFALLNDSNKNRKAILCNGAGQFIPALIFITSSVFAPASAMAQDDSIPTLHALIADLKSQNAELKELVDYQKELLALLNVDPAAVWAARRPYSECLTSVLASYCEPFGAMYLPPPKDTINQANTGKE